MKLRKLALKKVLQLDINGKLIGECFAQEEAFHPNVFSLPPNAVDVELPKNFNPDVYDYYYLDNKWHKEKKVVEEKDDVPKPVELTPLEYAKAYRQHLLDTATVYVNDREFDTNEDSLSTLTQTVTYLNEEDKLNWVLHNKTVAEVTVKELKEVLAKGISYKTQLWSKVYTDQEKMAKAGKEYLAEKLAKFNNEQKAN